MSIITIKQERSGAKLNEHTIRIEFIETEISYDGLTLVKIKEPYERYIGSELQRCIDYLLDGKEAQTSSNVCKNGRKSKYLFWKGLRKLFNFKG